MSAYNISNTEYLKVNYSFERENKNGKTVSGELSAEYYRETKTTSPKEISNQDGDYWDPSDDVEKSKGKNRVELNGFSLENIQDRIKEQILSQLYSTEKKEESSVSEDLNSILYEVEEGTEVAEVPEYWNAENTSQRIFDFAMSFRELYPDMSDEDYVAQVREAVEEGFRQAKDILGDSIDSPSKQLYNNTYESTMGLFDEYLNRDKTEEVASSNQAAIESASASELTSQLTGWPDDLGGSEKTGSTDSTPKLDLVA